MRFCNACFPGNRPIGCNRYYANLLAGSIFYAAVCFAVLLAGAVGRFIQTGCFVIRIKSNLICNCFLTLELNISYWSPDYETFNVTEVRSCKENYSQTGKYELLVRRLYSAYGLFRYKKWCKKVGVFFAGWFARMVFLLAPEVYSRSCKFVFPYRGF